MKSYDGFSLFAIDPGSESSGFVYLQADRTVRGGCFVVEKGHIPNTELRERLLGDPTLPGDYAIEMLASYGMTMGKSLIDTAIWIGRFQEVLSEQHVVTYTRKDVLLYLCNTHRGGDKEIKEALKERFQLPDMLKAKKGEAWQSHHYAALGVGVTYLDNDGGPVQ